MTTTLTKSTTVITPLQVLGYSSTRVSKNILHNILGRSDVDVTFNAAGLRSGTLSLLFSNYVAAQACEAIYASTGAITLADTTNTTLGMKHVSSGNIVVTLDDESRLYWTVAVDFQEVL
jgi:hypothetical protein